MIFLKHAIKSPGADADLPPLAPETLCRDRRCVEVHAAERHQSIRIAWIRDDYVAGAMAVISEKSIEIRSKFLTPKSISPKHCTTEETYDTHTERSQGLVIPPCIKGAIVCRLQRTAVGVRLQVLDDGVGALRRAVDGCLECRNLGCAARLEGCR